MNMLIKLKNKENIDEASDEKYNDYTITFYDLAAQAFVFYLGGYETSSSTITFALYELMLNMDIQEKLREEILSITKNYGGEVTYDGIAEMNYLDLVIKGKFFTDHLI